MKNQNFAEQIPLKKMRWRALLIALSLLWAGSAYANGGIVTDGSLGRPSTVFSPGIGGPDQVVITQSAGQISGHNLFQSFSNFNINKGQTVTFTEDQKGFVDNVIARVTGNETSTINGTLRVTPAGHANFYLLNPNGVLFGNGAQIDVPGDFHVTTAHFIKFQDGAKYSADPVQSKLSAANPSSFGFTGSSKGNNVLIEVKDGAQFSNPKDGPSANTLDLVGHNIKVDNGGQVSANDVRLVATKGTGSVTLDRDSYGYLKLPTSMPTAAAAGKVVIDGQDTAITSSTDGGGRVGIWGGNVSITNSATIKIYQTGNENPSPSNGVTVKASSFRMANGGVVDLEKTSPGIPANVYIHAAGNISVMSGSNIYNYGYYGEDGTIINGDINMISGGSILFKGIVTNDPNIAGTGIIGGNIYLYSAGPLKLTDESYVSGYSTPNPTVSTISSASGVSVSNGSQISMGSNFLDSSTASLSIRADSLFMSGAGTLIKVDSGINPRLNIYSEKGVSMIDGSKMYLTSHGGNPPTANVFTGGGLILQGGSGIYTLSSDQAGTPPTPAGDIMIHSEYIYLDKGFLVSNADGGRGSITLDVDSIFAIGNELNGNIYWGGAIPKTVTAERLIGNGNVITVDNHGLGGNVVISGSLLNLSGDMASLPPVNFTPKGVSNACDVSTKGNLALSGKGGSKASALDKAIFGY